jgi:hypothetical protein
MIEQGLSENKTAEERRIEKYCESVEKLLSNISEKRSKRKKIQYTFEEEPQLTDDFEELL